MIFQSPFFPVPPEHLPNRPDVEMIRAGEMRIGGFDVSAIAAEPSRRRARVSRPRA